MCINTDIMESNMGKRKALVYPQAEKKLKIVGEQIKLARLRRHLTELDVAERARIGRSSVIQIEKGAPSVSMGIYLAVLSVLGLQDDILLLARDDVMGRTFQDLELKTPRRGKKHETKPE